MTAKERGQAGEVFAADRLRERGFEILDRNWRWGRNEIDIIARKNAVIAFVEVKLRCAGSLTTPAGSLRRGQMRRIVEAAHAYLKEKGLYDSGLLQPRFDVFEITVREPDGLEVVDFYHMEHAYDLEGLGVFL